MVKKVVSKKGFTLIELLIVVAIIAILAAIAIPNFLAAQIRAKVARVKGNARTAATALESYYIDNNTYPGAVPSDGTFTWAIPVVVTTPVAYITSVPDDIFDTFGSLGPGFIPIKYRVAGWAFSTHNASGYSNASFTVNSGPGNVTDDQTFSTRELNNTNIQYIVFSMGPAQSLAHAQFGTGFWSDPASSGTYPQPHRMWYDPTNGTVSLGYVARESGGSVSP